MDDASLERRLFAPAGYNPPPSKPLPDWGGHVHAELRRRGVTLALLWEEYRSLHADGYGYSRFCDLYGEWRRGVTATMRQTHAAGEKLFVDFAGDTVPVFDAVTGEVRDAKIFVAVLGASNYSYVEACASEALPDWIAAHVHAFTFLGGVTKAVVCDNLKAGVTVANRYEPGVNRTYQDLARHYGTTIMPTRPRKPRDKAKVEAAVLVIERWILARLRNQRFFSLVELNTAIRALVDELNERVMRKLGASRREFFETIDRPALMPLPAELYQYAEWRHARVAPDYHIELQRHFYSVPSRLIRQVVEGADHAEHRRGVLSRCAGRQPCTLVRAASPHHDPGAHAERPSSICVVDAGALDRRRREDRTVDDCAMRGDHAGQAPSRTGLPILSRHPHPGTRLRPGPPRSRVSARDHHRGGKLPVDRLDP